MVIEFVPITRKEIKFKIYGNLNMLPIFFQIKGKMINKALKN